MDMHRHRTSIFLIAAMAAVVILLGPGSARAELLRGPYEYPSAITFDGHIGLQLGLGGYTPGGLKLQLNYSHRFASSRDRLMGVWFFIDLAGVAGPGVGVCMPEVGPVFECGAVGYGSDIEIKSGIQLTWRTPVPVVPFLKMGAAIAGVFARDYCGDSGVGVPLAAVGGGARYFFTKHFALSVGADLHLGPAFYSSGKEGRCFPGDHNELWRSLSFLLGMHYAL
jgi:hypothetical protein